MNRFKINNLLRNLDTRGNFEKARLQALRDIKDDKKAERGKKAVERLADCYPGYL